jgi:hypothetical protein
MHSCRAPEELERLKEMRVLGYLIYYAQSGKLTTASPPGEKATAR